MKKLIILSFTILFLSNFKIKATIERAPEDIISPNQILGELEKAYASLAKQNIRNLKLDTFDKALQKFNKYLKSKYSAVGADRFIGFNLLCLNKFLEDGFNKISKMNVHDQSNSLKDLVNHVNTRIVIIEQNINSIFKCLPQGKELSLNVLDYQKKVLEFIIY